jgi:hypothetical protein
MTRKKWNRLRKQRPELFTHLTCVSWEDNARQCTPIRKMSKSQIIATLTEFQLTKEVVLGWPWVIDNRGPLK